MKKNLLALVLCLVMLVSVALVTAGCSSNTNTTEPSTTAAPTETAAPETTVPETAAEDTKAVETGDVTVLGEGETVFSFTVTDLDGKETPFEIHTDKATVGEALVELGLIAGDDSDYGLYVKTVNGLTLDYDKDGKYWAFYVNGEYAATGVDSTNVEAGAVYAFKAE